MKYIYLTLIVIFFVAVIGCERKSRELADVPPKPKSYASNDVAPATHTLPVTVGGKELDGEKLYATACAACHQVSGQGVPGAFPPLDGSKWVTTDNVEVLSSIMLYGLQGPVDVKGTTYNGVMTAQMNVLDDEQLAAVATYVRGAWSNKAGAVQSDVFSAMKTKWGTRAMLDVATLKEELGDL